MKIAWISSMTCFAVTEIPADVFFKYPFASLLRPKNLVEYTVMNIEVIPEHERRKFSGQGAVSKKVGSCALKQAFLDVFSQRSNTRRWGNLEFFWKFLEFDQKIQYFFPKFPEFPYLKLCRKNHVWENFWQFFLIQDFFAPNNNTITSQNSGSSAIA